MFKRNPSADLAKVTMWFTEWHSFQKGEVIKGNGYWTSQAEGAHPLLISLSLEWKTIS